MHRLALPLALCIAACAPMDYTSVSAQPGETFVIEGNSDQVGGAMDPLVKIMAAEACAGDHTPQRIAVDPIGIHRARHTFTC